MMKKSVLLLLLLASMGFAAWQNVAGIAIITSLMLVLIVFMIGYGFGVEILSVTAKDEIYQLIVLIFLLVILFGANNVIDSISSIKEFSGEQANMQTSALVSLNNTMKNLTSAYDYVLAADKEIGYASTRVLSCSIGSMGYSVSGCGGFSMLAGPFSIAGSIMGFALGELNGIYRLIELSLTYSLTLLLPAGIILRTFRITRGAGGFLIGIAVCMHLLLPLGILFVDMLGDSFLASSDASGYSTTVSSLSSVGSAADLCEEGNTGDDNSDSAISVYKSLRTDMKSFLFLVLIKATLGPIAALLMLVSGIRFVTAFAGAEVDVSALGRVI